MVNEDFGVTEKRLVSALFKPPRVLVTIQSASYNPKC